MFNFFNTESYVEISSGSCETHGMNNITSKAQCEAAAQYLGLGDTSADPFQQSGYPYGCLMLGFHHDGGSWGLLWYSPTGAPAASAACGIIVDSDAYDCICNDQGMNLPFYFVIYGTFITVYIK